MKRLSLLSASLTTSRSSTPTQSSRGCSSPQPAQNASSSPHKLTPTLPRFPMPFYVDLTPLKPIFDDEAAATNEVIIDLTIARTISRNTLIDVNLLSGLYAYILVLIKELGQQLLIVNALQDYESNHGALALFLSKLKSFPDYYKKEIHILAGGEIEYEGGLIQKWNLKSSGYSKNTKFDELEPNFEESRKTLWLPQNKYQPIREICYPYGHFFAPTGARKVKKFNSLNLTSPSQESGIPSKLCQTP